MWSPPTTLNRDAFGGLNRGGLRRGPIAGGNRGLLFRSRGPFNSGQVGPAANWTPSSELGAITVLSFFVPDFPFARSPRWPFSGP